MSKLNELLSQREAKKADAAKILAKSEYAPGDVELAEKLSTEIDGICAEIDRHNAELKRADEIRSRLQASDRFMSEPQRTLPFSAAGDNGQKAARIDGGESEVDRLAGTGGFKTIGSFAHAVFQKGRNGGRDSHGAEMLRKWNAIQPELAVKEAREQERMGFKSPSGLYEESDPDGGDLVPREFSNNIYQRTLDMGQILSYLSPIQVMGNTLTVPALAENSRVDGSRQGGLLAYWEGEADQYTKSKPTFRNVSNKLKKLTVLSFVTEELLNDSPTALDGWLGQKVPIEINFKINDAVINGNGVGVPQGIFNSGSKITATAVSGQGSNTIVAKNILAMYKRVVYSQRKSMVWLYNQATEDQLYSLFQPTGSTSGVLFFAPNAEKGNFQLMGRPALCVEQCADLGTEGDIIAFAPEGYFAITKGGIQSFMSMHLRFDYDEFCYKWRFRFDGRPYDDVALTPYKGSTTYSSIVTLSGTRT